MMRPLHHTGYARVETTPDDVRVVMPREIDLSNAPSIGQEILVLLNAGADPLILDLSGTRFCDSQGVNLIVRAIVRARGLHSRLVLVVPEGGGPRRVLDIYGLTRFIPTTQTLDEARTLIADMPAPS
jgi:anti-anti-sigma factor